MASHTAIVDQELSSTDNSDDDMRDNSQIMLQNQSIGDRRQLPREAWMNIYVKFYEDEDSWYVILEPGESDGEDSDTGLTALTAIIVNAGTGEFIAKVNCGYDTDYYSLRVGDVKYEIQRWAV